MDSLRGKRVLVTGGATGIGAGIVKAFSDYGARVGVHYRKSEAEAKALQEELCRENTNMLLFQADLLESVERERLIEDFLKEFGGIDVLVNNAGGPVGTDHFLELDQASWDETFALNVTAPFFLAQSVFPSMRNAGGGRIINISSIGVKYGGSEKTLHYNAAKASLEAVTRGLAKLGAEYNVLVNAVRPGVVDTAVYQFVSREDFQRRVDLVPLKRSGKPEEIAAMVRFLASDAGSYITGQIIAVSGGD